MSQRSKKIYRIELNAKANLRKITNELGKQKKMKTVALILGTITLAVMLLGIYKLFIAK